MKSAFRLQVGIWTACLSTVAAAQAPNPAVLKHVPDEAGLALVVPSLDKLGGAVSAFFEAVKLPDMPEMSGEEVVAAILSATFEHSAGLDTSGTFVVAMVPTDMPKPIFICGLKDAAAWKSNAVPADGGKLYNIVVQGGDWKAAIEGDTLILSEDETAIKAALASTGKFAKSLAGKSRGMLRKHQAVLIADVPAWKEHIEQGVTMADGMVQFGMVMSAGPQAQSALQMWQWASKQFRSLAAQTQTLVVGAGVAADGIHLDNLMTFDPEGKLAAYLKGVRKTKGHLLRGIASGPFAMAFGTEWESESDGTAIIGGLFEAMKKAAATDESIDQSKLEAGIKKSLAMLQKVNGYNGTVASGGEGVGMVVSGTYFCDHPAEIVKEVAALMEVNQDLMKAFSTGVESEISQREEKIDGHDVTVFDVEFSSDDPEMTQMIETVYGGSTSSYMAVKGKELVYVFGSKEAARKRMAKTLGAKSPGLAANTRVAEALREIPPSPQLIGLIDIGQLAKWGIQMAVATGQPIPPIKIKAAHAPLLVFGGYLGRNAVRGSMFLPAEAVRKVLSSTLPGGDPDEED